MERDWNPIGASTVRKALLVLGIMLRFAIGDHVVKVNPVRFVKKPAQRTRKAAHQRPPREKLVKLFASTRGRTRIVVRIAAATGMREGEIFGPRWRGVDLKARTIQLLIEQAVRR